ncbi:MAG: AarF/ABC1/UbiB kinase family protein, partial [Anaerolineales bacterium]|nr:AarF/ABC1/UbiB kinase family protein [Anaerolineales bacterium]
SRFPQSPPDFPKSRYNGRKMIQELQRTQEQVAAAGQGAAGAPPAGAAGIDARRYRRILFFFGRIIAHVILWDLLGGRLPLLGPRVRASRPRRFRRWARRFRMLAVEMGGVMIKLGQFLSVRVDVLPPEIIEELQGLQDEVPAVPFAQVTAVLQAELGDYTQHFAAVETQPLAAASLGQAHRAWLWDETHAQRGAAVIVKVQRPHIEQIVQTDLAALRIVAQWVMRYRPIRRRADVPALMAEFAETLWEELDYVSEAANAERFAAMYAGDDDVVIPRVYRQHSTGRVIVLENVEAIKITDVAGMRAAGIEPVAVADLLLDAYFRQFFVEGFFHADPHPGNLFVRPKAETAWPSANGTEPPLGRPFQLIFIDFGMVGRIPDMVGDNLRKILVSVTQRDTRALTAAYAELGFFLPGADLARIAEAQQAVLNKIWGRNLLALAQPDPKELQELGQEFRDLLFDFPFQIPQDFIYLGRALGMVSGLVSLLNPDINPWAKIEQYGEEMLRSQDGREAARDTLVALIRPYLAAPARVRRLLEAAEKGQLRVQNVPSREELQHFQRVERRLSQIGWSILGGAGMVSGALLLARRLGGKMKDEG